ncbi:hypothetical protein HID58_042623 [Brassica napus]|uniref:Uncharacterized protein n=1 Tax=Brassica napus TaxID=3708 RepID=A0ABQ8BE95_BRANA|nr:hypothetical protein HID58_042623 [Brassica napus]
MEKNLKTWIRVEKSHTLLSTNIRDHISVQKKLHGFTRE